MRNLRKAQAILRLAEKYGKERMDAAPHRALYYLNLHYRAIKRILEKGLDEEVTPTPVRVSLPLRFAFPQRPCLLCPGKAGGLLNLNHQFETQLKVLRLGDLIESL